MLRVDLRRSRAQFEHAIVVRHEEGLGGSVVGRGAEVLPGSCNLLASRGVMTAHCGLRDLLNVCRGNEVIVLICRKADVRGGHQRVRVAQCL